MTGWIKSVRDGFDDQCIVGRCRKPGCAVGLAGFPGPDERVIVDFDKPGSPLLNATACDFLVVAAPSCDTGWVAPMELKSGGVDVSDAAQQLREGARIAEQRVTPHHAENVVFRPVLATGRIDKAERNDLQKKKHHIRFRNGYEPIRRIRCGAPLADVFPD